MLHGRTHCGCRAIFSAGTGNKLVDRVDQDDADGKLRDIYELASVDEDELVVPNVVKIGSPNLDALEPWRQLFRIPMFDSSCLTRAHREMLAVRVFCPHECHYSVEHHGEFLRTVTRDDDFAASRADPDESLPDGKQATIHAEVRGKIHRQKCIPAEK